MSYQNNLDASFKSVPFYVTEESLPAFGREIVTHLYPNSAEQFAEDTGGLPEVFSVTGFMIGENAKDQMQALINACNEVGFGQLILPYFGERRVKAGKGSVAVSPNISVDRIDFSVEFYTSREKAGYVEAEPTPQTVYANGDVVRELSGEVFGEFYQTGDIAEVTNYDFSAMVTSIDNLRSIIPPLSLPEILTKINIVNNAMNDLVNDAVSFSKLFSGVDGVYSLLSTAFIGNGAGRVIDLLLNEVNSFERRLPTDIYSLNKGASSTAYYQVNYWSDNTESRVIRNQSRAGLADYHRMNLLTIAYEQLAGMTFNTEQEADAAKDAVEMAYIELAHGITGISYGTKLKTNDNAARSYVAGNERVWQAFETVRLNALKSAESNNVILYKVESAQIENYYGMSILNLTYHTQAEQLQSENDLMAMTKVMFGVNGRKPYALTGNVKVLRRAVV
jgi:hypothetical protein